MCVVPFDFSSVSASPSIEGVFGKDWCMDLWKGGEKRSPPPRPSEEVRRCFQSSAFDPCIVQKSRFTCEDV